MSQTPAPNPIRSLIDRARLVARLMRDPRVPLYLKALPIGAVLYVIFPLDLLPDLALGLGQLDDLGVLLVGLETFIALCPRHVVEEHAAAISGAPPRGETIEGEWRVKE